MNQILSSRSPALIYAVNIVILLTLFNFKLGTSQDKTQGEGEILNNTYHNASGLRPTFGDSKNIQDIFIDKDDVTVTLHCRASGNPLPTLFWVKNSTRLKATKYRNVSDSEVSSELQVSRTGKGAKSIAGLYICLAQNSVGRNAIIFKVQIKSNETTIWQRLGWIALWIFISTCGGPIFYCMYFLFLLCVGRYCKPPGNQNARQVIST